MSSRILLTAVCFFQLAAFCTAQDLAPIVFPDLEGWAKGTRYDEAPPRGRVPRSSINYTTKAKVGKDYVRADVEVTLAGGKDIKELLPDFEKKILENPVQQNSKKLGSDEVKVGERTVTRSRFSSSFGANNPVETELYVIPYGKHVIRLQHTGPNADSEARTAEVGKLIGAIVEAAK
jgi:hypothetical protein